MRFRLRRAGQGFLPLSALLFAGCLFYGQATVQEIDPTVSRLVESPVRAHLLNLSSVFFQDGVLLTGDVIRGRGRAYGVRMEPLGTRNEIPIDSLAGLEALTGGNLQWGNTLVASTLAAGAAVLATVALAVAIVGSCPTFYGTTADGFALEAEGFSYSISPLLEARDVDVLRSVQAKDGWIELELRNEALETHFINHLEILAAETEPGERIFPDVDGGMLAVGGLRSPVSMVDAAGRDLRSVLSTADGVAYETPMDRIRAARDGDPFDHIIIEVPPQPDGEAVMVLRLRNSLLTTLLFYDLMLAPGGIKTLDWMTEDMQRIDKAVEMAFWAREYLGLRVEVEGDNGFEPVSKVSDTGPIAWEEVAITVPAHPERTTRIRLSFLADAWRIDQVALAKSWREPDFRRVPVAEVLGPDGELEPDAVRALRSPDEEYLETRPTHRMTLRFPVGPKAGSYLLASQGYYTEWVRPQWIREAHSPRHFEPNRDVIRELHTRWLDERADLEERFFSSAIPVR